MLYLMLPCLCSSENQVKSHLSILEECHKAGYSIGLELFTRMDDLDNSRELEATVQNLINLPKDMLLSLHAPLELKRGSTRNFFCAPSLEAEVEHFAKLAEWVDALDVGIVNFHAHRIFTFDELSRLNPQQVEDIRTAHLDKMGNILQLLEAKYLPGKKICIENVPYCLTSDLTSDPREILYEACFTNLRDFHRITGPGTNVFATIDTCHLAQMYDSSELISEISGISDILGHVHFSDLGKNWQPFMDLTEEGVVPGDGRIGRQVMKNLLEHFFQLGKSRDLGLVVETLDVDHNNPVQKAKAIKRILSWLSELS